MVTKERFIELMIEGGFSPERANLMWDRKPEGLTFTEDTLKMSIIATRLFEQSRLPKWEPKLN